MGALRERFEEVEEGGAGFGFDDDLPSVAARSAFVESWHYGGNLN